MLQNKKTRTIIAVILSVILVLSTITMIYIEYKQQPKIAPPPAQNVAQNQKQQEITFSAEKFFYNQEVSLELSVNTEVAEKEISHILFTTDSTPPQTSDTAEYYDLAIILECGYENENVNSYTIKACPEYSDGTKGETVTHSYFVGENVDERFNTLVFSVSTDPYNLYDYEYGIFTEGKIRDDYIKESGDRKPEPPAPANFNMRGIDWERPAYLEVFEADGEKVISQNIGVRNFGGYSRALEQKSIKLFARREYDTCNEFDYDFFPEDLTQDGRRVTEYKRLVLRNCANDSPFGFVRDETILNCTDLTPLRDTQQTRAAAVFLNGEYYGFAWLHEVYDDNYCDAEYGVEDGEWAIIKGGEGYKITEENDPISIASEVDYKDMYGYAYQDLTNDDYFNNLCNRMDIENFLYYYAIQVYVSNHDWPGGNYRVYRYWGDLNAESSVELDHKWRWMIFDTDFGLGLYDTPASVDSLGRVLGRGEGKAPLLKAILQRDDMKKKFTEIMCDVMNWSYSPTSIYRSMTEKANERQQELEYAFKYSYLKNSWSSLNRVSEEEQKIIDFATYRPLEMQYQLVDELDLVNSTYKVTAAKNKNAIIKLNSCEISEDKWNFEGEYFDICEITLDYEIGLGHEFDAWLINGNRVEEKSLILSKDNAVNGEIDIKILTKTKSESDDGKYPIISEVKYNGTNDYFVIYNPYSYSISTSNLYVSDEVDNKTKQLMPLMVLKAGESKKIFCSNYNASEALGEYMVGFSLKEEETLGLYDYKGDEISKVYLNLTDKTSKLVLDLINKRYFEALA
ncbi:MAG: hypothetical protein GX896_01325 [Clostridiales bacterium]|nr:hypothetical protein [Clostridiales bacterium]